MTCSEYGILHGRQVRKTKSRVFVLVRDGQTAGTSEACDTLVDVKRPHNQMAGGHRVSGLLNMVAKARKVLDRRLRPADALSRYTGDRSRATFFMGRFNSPCRRRPDLSPSPAEPPIIVDQSRRFRHSDSVSRQAEQQRGPAWLSSAKDALHCRPV